MTSSTVHHGFSGGSAGRTGAFAAPASPAPTHVSVRTFRAQISSSPESLQPLSRGAHGGIRGGRIHVGTPQGQSVGGSWRGTAFSPI